MDWCQQRTSIPREFGWIKVDDKPEAAQILKVPGGIEHAAQVAARLILRFEQNLNDQNDTRFRLRRIYLRDGLKIVQLCPFPLINGPKSSSLEWCSLGVCVSHRPGEIWFIAKVSVSGEKLSWRVDIAERPKPVLFFCTRLFAIFWFVSLSTYFLMAPFPISLLLIWMLFSFMAWPFKFMSNGKESRLNRAREYLPDILDAWMDALREAESSLPCPTNLLPVAGQQVGSLPSPISSIPTPHSQWSGRKPRI